LTWEEKNKAFKLQNFFTEQLRGGEKNRIDKIEYGIQVKRIDFGRKKKTAQQTSETFPE